MPQLFAYVCSVLLHVCTKYICFKRGLNCIKSIEKIHHWYNDSSGALYFSPDSLESENLPNLHRGTPYFLENNYIDPLKLVYMHTCINLASYFE